MAELEDRIMDENTPTDFKDVERYNEFQEQAAALSGSVAKRMKMPKSRRHKDCPPEVAWDIR